MVTGSMPSPPELSFERNNALCQLSREPVTCKNSPHSLFVTRAQNAIIFRGEVGGYRLMHVELVIHD